MRRIYTRYLLLATLLFKHAKHRSSLTFLLRYRYRKNDTTIITRSSMPPNAPEYPGLIMTFVHNHRDCFSHLGKIPPLLPMQHCSHTASVDQFNVQCCKSSYSPLCRHQSASRSQHQIKDEPAKPRFYNLSGVNRWIWPRRRRFRAMG